MFEQAGAKFQFAPEGLTVFLGEEVLAKLVADEALGLGVGDG